MTTEVLERNETKKKILFVCPSTFNLVLVLKSEVRVEGELKQRPHHIRFLKRTFGGSYRGEYVTDDPVEIDFLRNHEWFRKGPAPQIDEQIIVDKATGKVVGTYGQSLGTQRFFYETAWDPENIDRTAPETVRVFGSEKEKIEIESPAPEEPSHQPLKAKVAKGLRNTRQPA